MFFGSASEWFNRCGADFFNFFVIKYCKIVEIKVNNDYWLFIADNDEYPIDDNVGSVYINKKTGELKLLELWDVEFNSEFSKNAKTISNI